MFVRAALSCLVLLVISAAGSRADELADRVCPILQNIAEGSATKADYAVQADVVMQVGGEYNFDPEALKNLLADVDESTAAGCPEARNTILKVMTMDSLASVMR